MIAAERGVAKYIAADECRPSRNRFIVDVVHCLQDLHALPLFVRLYDRGMESEYSIPLIKTIMIF